MGRHPNAKLTPRGRKTLVPRMESVVPIVDAARQMGVGRQTASKWLRRSRPGEAPSDRNGRTRRLEKSTPAARSRPLRYERERPGELVHVDVKKTARIPDGGGHRALGRGCVSADGARRRACTSTARRAPGACAASSSTVSGPSAQRVRGPSAHVAHRRPKQPIDTQHLVMQQIPIFFRPEK